MDEQSIGSTVHRYVDPAVDDRLGVYTDSIVHVVEVLEGSDRLGVYSGSFVRIVDAPDTGDRLGVYLVFGAEYQDRLGEYLVVLVKVAPWVLFSVVVVELWLV